MDEHTSAPQSTAPQPVATQPMEAPKTGTVVGQNSTASKELSGGATAGISIAIGVGNVCCGPTCYTCPTIISSIVGIVLYASWKQDKPKTAKTILTVTLITAAVAFLGFGVLFTIGLAGSIIDSATYSY